MPIRLFYWSTFRERHFCLQWNKSLLLSVYMCVCVYMCVPIQYSEMRKCLFKWINAFGVPYCCWPPPLYQLHVLVPTYKVGFNPRETFMVLKYQRKKLYSLCSITAAPCHYRPMHPSMNHLKMCYAKKMEIYCMYGIHYIVYRYNRVKMDTQCFTIYKRDILFASSSHQLHGLFINSRVCIYVVCKFLFCFYRCCWHNVPSQEIHIPSCSS